MIDVKCLGHQNCQSRIACCTVGQKRERGSMRKGQTSPYLNMLRAAVPAARVEIIEDTGHFPQLDESAQTNALIDSFVGPLRVG